MSCTARSDEMYRTLEFHAADRLPPAADVLPRGISLCGAWQVMHWVWALGASTG